MKEFVVFYAWQSDRPERLNRHLIRIALNLAAKNISDDPATGVRIRIDARMRGILWRDWAAIFLERRGRLPGQFAVEVDVKIIASIGNNKLLPPFRFDVDRRTIPAIIGMVFCQQKLFDGLR